MSSMHRVAAALLLASTPVLAEAGVDACHGEIATVAGRQASLSSVAIELAPANSRLGGDNGVLVQSFDEALSVDSVLARIRIDGCLAVARASVPADPSIIDPATYKPQTAFDNTPWRFDMTQNGKRMTADEFDAWMKARGVRVVRAAAPAAEVVASEGKQPD